MRGATNGRNWYNLRRPPKGFELAWIVREPTKEEPAVDPGKLEPGYLSALQYHPLVAQTLAEAVSYLCYLDGVKKDGWIVLAFRTKASPVQVAKIQASFMDPVFWTVKNAAERREDK